jgi:hypothetical protein
MYQAMLDSDIIPHNIFLWKLKIPLKVKSVPLAAVQESDNDERQFS